MSKYSSFEEIEKDLKRLNLERQIAKEQMIGLKYEFEDIMSPYSLVLSALNLVKKYGIYFFLKKLFR